MSLLAGSPANHAKITNLANTALFVPAAPMVAG